MMNPHQVVAALTSADDEMARLRAVNAQLVHAVLCYRDDLRRPPSVDSKERRLEMVNKLIAAATGEKL